MDDYTLLHGDCLEEMAAMDAGSVDAVCTDSPYGYSFMGRGWDHAVPGVEFWTEALRLLKPSCYLVSMGGTRTWHRLACALEDAGFEIRDTLMWLYGSGFPKGKSCLKPAWEPIILARKPGPMRELGIEECQVGTVDDLNGGAYSHNRDASTNKVYGEYQRLHPDDFPSPSGRWPANLVLECTCDETREGTAKGSAPASGPTLTGESSSVARGKFKGVDATPCYSGSDGKEPVRIHTDPNCPCAMLDGQTGTLSSGKFTKRKTRMAGEIGKAPSSPSGWPTDKGEWDVAGNQGGDSGGASRFFYCAKASRSERNKGCEGMEERDLSSADKWSTNDRRSGTNRQPTEWKASAQNHHPTVKPVALMRWLVRLVARPGDVVVDPFAGSGTTGVACVMEGREFIGIDQDAEYVEIARRRIAHASAQTRLPVE